MSRYKHGNIALHLGFPVSVGTDTFEVVGIDVDDYGEKHGGKQLAALEAEHGRLPDTFISSARSDGVSGIRFFLVPVGLDFRGKAAGAIEIVQKKHRYAVVWPSVNPDPGTRYVWHDYGQVPDGTNTLPAVPDVTALPRLPEAWLAFLTNGLSPDVDVPVDTVSTPDELVAWTATAFGGEPDNVPCERMHNAVEKWLTAIVDEESSHDKITNGHWEILQLASEGHPGWRTATAQLEEVYIRTTLKRGKRGVGEVRDEIARSYIHALRKLRAGYLGGKAACPCFPAEGTEDYELVMAALAPGSAWRLQRRPGRYRRLYRPRYRPAYRARGGARHGA